MIYGKFEDECFEDRITFVEIVDGYAVRSITIDGGRHFASNRKDSEEEYSLPEGKIEPSEIDGFQTIRKDEFEQIWMDYCKGILPEWLLTKSKYQVGNKIEGYIEVFYPQGIIINIMDSATGITDYNNCREKNDPKNLYPGHKVQAIVKGYDEVNFWLILDQVMVYEETI